MTVFFVGPPEGIRTPDLQNRNLLRYPTAPRAEMLSYYENIHQIGSKVKAIPHNNYCTVLPCFKVMGVEPDMV